MNETAAVDALAAIRLKLDELEVLIRESGAAQSHDDLPTFDPDTDTPPVTPLVDGSRLQRNWCSLVLWSRLRAVNVRQGRAATPEESVRIAKDAGYQDGRGWNAWTLGWEKDADGGRWMTEDGMIHLQHAADAVGYRIASDLA